MPQKPSLFYKEQIRAKAHELWKTLSQKPALFHEEQIRAKAHELWKAPGGASKLPEENWQAAIKALEAEHWLPRRVGKAVWKWTGFGQKTLWDFLQLLIVPSLLAGGVFGLQEFAKQREQEIQKSATQREQQISDGKENQETLVNYLDQMAELLKDGLLKAPSNSEKFIIGQAKTVTALQSLDPQRQHLVIQFLAAASLNTLNGKGILSKARMSKATLPNSDFSDASLSGANLSGANLSGANLSGADLSKTDLSSASLSGANLSGANLSETNFSNANLSGANLGDTDNLGKQTNLMNANLSGANLSNTELHANLSNADLSNANLSNAKLDGIDFKNANLSNANLRYADFEENMSASKSAVGEARLCNTKLPITASESMGVPESMIDENEIQLKKEWSDLDTNRDCDGFFMEDFEKEAKEIAEEYRLRHSGNEHDGTNRIPGAETTPTKAE